MANSAKGGINVTINATGKAEITGLDEVVRQTMELDDTLQKVVSTFATMSRGHNIGKYWDEQYKSIEKVKQVYEEFKSDLASGTATSSGAEDFLKTINAFTARNGGNIRDYFDQFESGFQRVIADAKSMAKSLDSAFEPENLRQAFSVLDSLKDTGEDVYSVIDKLGSANADQLTAKIQELESKLMDTKMRLYDMQQTLSRIGEGRDINGVLEQIEELERSISRIRSKAADEFGNFLSANNIDRSFYGAQEVFQEIYEGSLTASEGIARFKAEYSHMFEGGLQGSASEIYAILARIESSLAGIPTALQDAVRNIGELQSITRNAGEGADAIRREKSEAQELANTGANLQPVVDSLANIATNMNVAGEGANETLVSIREMIEALGRLGSIDGGNLTNLSVMLRSIASMNGFTASSKGLASIVETLDKLSGFTNTRALLDLSQVDLSNIKVSKAALSNLAEFLPRIQNVDITPLQRLSELNWTNLAALKVSSTDAKNVQTLLGATGLKTDVVDASGAKAAFQSISESLVSLKGRIADTFDLSKAIADAGTLEQHYANIASSLQTISSATAQISAGSTGAGSSGGRQRESNELSQLIALYEQYYSYRTKEAQAINNSEAQNADLFKSRAQVIWEVIGAIEAENTELAELAGAHERVTAAVRNYQEASNHIQAQATHKEEAQSLRDKEQALKSVVSQYTKMYELQAKSVEAATSGRTDDAEYYQRQADAIRDLIGSLETLVPDLTDQAKRSEEVAAAIEKYNLAITKSNTANNKAALDEVISQYEKFYDLQSKMVDSANKGKIIDATEYDRQAESVGAWIQRLETLFPELTEQAKRSDEVTAAIERYNVAMEKGVHAASTSADSLGIDSSGIKFAFDTDAVNRYLDALSTLHARLDDIHAATDSDKSAAILAYEEQRQKVIELREELNNAAVAAKNMQNAQASATKLADRIETYLSKNGRISSETQAQMQGWVNELRSGEAVAKGTTSKIASSFESMTSSIKRAGEGGKTFFQQMKEGWAKFGGWSLVTRSFTKVISTFKQAVTAVKEVDAAMTELRKVTDLTDQGYARLYENMAQMATKVGAKLSDTINSVANFSRLGFNAADSLKLSEAALVYFNVGDQLENIDEATSSIISTLKAFKIEASDAMNIVDMFNEVGRLLPIPVVTRCLVECYIGQSSVGKCA